MIPPGMNGSSLFPPPDDDRGGLVGVPLAGTNGSYTTLFGVMAPGETAILEVSETMVEHIVVGVLGLTGSL